MFGKAEERKQEFLEKVRYYEGEWEKKKDALHKKKLNAFELPTHSKYCLLEEECLFWSLESLKNPLSEDGYKRYMDCIQKLCHKYNVKNPLQKVV